MVGKNTAFPLPHGAAVVDEKKTYIRCAPSALSALTFTILVIWEYILVFLLTAINKKG